MKYGLLTDSTRSLNSEIKEFGRMGFDYTEINMEEPYGTPQIIMKDKNSILKLLKNYNMFALAHTPFWDDFGSLHKDVRLGWVKEAHNMVLASSELKIKYLNFHFWGGNSQSKKIKAGRKLFLKSFVESMRDVTAFAKVHGITVMLENMTPYKPETAYMINDFAYVVNNTPLLKVHLDVGHAYIEGGNKKIDEYIKRFSAKIVHIHVHDNHGEKDEHLSLGEGDINFKRVVSSLKRIGYDKTVTFEVFKSKLDPRTSRKKFEALWKKS